MRTKTTFYCDGLDADGTPCTSHFERDSEERQRGLGRNFMPPGWWAVDVVKVIPPRERPPQPNIFERGPVRNMMKAMMESITPPDLERSDEIKTILARLKGAVGDVGNAGLMARLAADLAVLEVVADKIVSTPERLEEQMQKMWDGLSSGYAAGADDGLPAPRDRLFPVHAVLCDKHAQPAVQFDEAKVPHWAGMSVCDHDNSMEAVDGLMMEEVPSPLGGLVQFPVGYGG